jgi:hypothetical protein
MRLGRKHTWPKWRNGRRRGFKIPRWQQRASSSLALGTTFQFPTVFYHMVKFCPHGRNELAFDVVLANDLARPHLFRAAVQTIDKGRGHA